MATLDDLFRSYLHMIEPPPNAVKRASDSHNSLRDAIEKDKEFGPFVQGTLLSGSYGRDTSVFYIKDVDIVIFTTFTLDDLNARKKKDETEQACLLRLTREAIERTGLVAGTRPNRRSIQVELPKEVNDLGEDVPALTLDIVPLLNTNTSEKDPWMVADKESSRWEPTYPLTQLGDSIKRNENSYFIGDRNSYKPLVKIQKARKYVHYSTKQKYPKGLVLECLAARYHVPTAEHWIDAVLELFRGIAAAYPGLEYWSAPPRVRDVSDSSPVTIEIAKTTDQAKEFISRVEKHAKIIEQAKTEAETDLFKAAKTLQRVFGQEGDVVTFPLPDEDSGGDGSKRQTFQATPFVRTGSKSKVEEAPPFG